jgi:hypothetical protein
MEGSPRYGIPGEVPKAPPDIGAMLVYAKAPALLMVSVSDAVIRDPKYQVLLWNLDGDHADALQIPVYTASGDYIRARESIGPFGILSSPGVSPFIKQGNRLFGYMTVTCPDCLRTKEYWVYIDCGTGGWYSELPTGQHVNLTALVRNIPNIANDLTGFVSAIPVNVRTVIKEFP